MIEGTGARPTDEILGFTSREGLLARLRANDTWARYRSLSASSSGLIRAFLWPKEASLFCILSSAMPQTQMWASDGLTRTPRKPRALVRYLVRRERAIVASLGA